MILTIKGKVFTGVSEGKRFTELPWVKKQITKQLGFEPYPGTLNLLVSSDFQMGNMLSRFRGRAILPEEGHFSGRLYKALIMESVLGALVRPEISGYPEDTVEILAPICLREEFDLRDGDEVEIKIWLE